MKVFLKGNYPNCRVQSSVGQLEAMKHYSCHEPVANWQVGFSKRPLNWEPETLNQCSTLKEYKEGCERRLYLP